MNQKNKINLKIKIEKEKKRNSHTMMESNDFHSYTL